MKYDLDLFLKLNNEYKEKPVKSVYSDYSHEFLIKSARKRAITLSKFINLKNKHVLEIGCGRGHIVDLLRNDYECNAEGVDLISYNEWNNLGETKKHLYKINLLDSNPFSQSSFDLIFSFAVYEHIENVFEFLKTTKGLLKEDGIQYIIANQYRSAIGSHLYREVFFPYPNLIFNEDVIIDYFSKYVEKDSFTNFMREKFFLNKLTYCHYKDYFSDLGYKVIYENLKTRPIDWEFYQRFSAKLKPYPINDLMLDFFEVVIVKSNSFDNEPIKSTFTNYENKIKDMQNEIKKLKIEIKQQNEDLRIQKSAIGKYESYPWLIIPIFLKKAIQQSLRLMKNFMSKSL